MGVLVFGGSLAPFPLAPTLRTPASGSYQDLAGTPAFSWQYNPGQAGSSLTMLGWVFDRLVNNSTVQQFWNADTGAWQSTPYVNGLSPTTGVLTNSGPIWTYAFPSGAFTDGNAYQWSIACQDANGTGPIAPYALVTAQQPPVVTVYLPTGTIDNACPTVVWSTVFAPGASQTAWRLCIYNSAQQGIGGFTPGVSPSLFDSGLVGSNATDVALHDIPLYLPTGDTYYFYVQVTETHGLVSDWAFTDATTSYTAPDSGALTAATGTDGTTGCPLVSLTAGSGVNMLSADDADPTLGIGSYTAVTGCTVSSTASGLEMAYVSGTEMDAITSYGLSGYPVVAGEVYSFMGSFKSSGASQPCSMGIEFYDSSGSSLWFESGDTIFDNSTSPTQSVSNTVAPAGAVYAALKPYVGTPGESHYVTECGLFPGVTTTWYPSGSGPTLAGSAIIQRSDGAYLRGASLNNPLPVTGGTIAIADYEAVPGTAYTYSLQIIVDTGGVYTASGISESNSVTLTTLGWWELDPNDPSTAFNAQVIAWQPQVTEQSTAHLVSGQAYPNVVAANMGGLDGQATFETFDPDTYASLQAMLQSQTTYFVSSPFGIVDTAYVRWGPQTGGASGGSGNKVKDSSLLPSTLAAMHRTTAVTWVAQARPPV